MPHSFSVRLEPDDARWIRARSAVMAVHESNFHAPCCEACGKEWGKTVPTAESDPFVMVLSKLHVHPASAEAFTVIYCQMARVCLRGRRHELYLRSSLALTETQSAKAQAIRSRAEQGGSSGELRGKQ